MYDSDREMYDSDREINCTFYHCDRILVNCSLQDHKDNLSPFH